MWILERIFLYIFCSLTCCITCLKTSAELLCLSLAGMIMGAAGSTVYYNLKLRHPTLEMPIIDYDLAMLFQPMLMLGISIGVAFNVIFADWMVTVLLIILFLGNSHLNCIGTSWTFWEYPWWILSFWYFAGTSTKAFLKGVETWKKETIMKKVAYLHIAT